MNKKKKILVLHNRYQIRGGEDIVMEKETELFSRYFEVETLFFSNIIHSKLEQIFYLLLGTNYASKKRLEKKLTTFQPDLCYVGNTWFEASLGIFKVLKKNNIKTFIKLHNSRHICCDSFFVWRHIKLNQYCSGCGQQRKKLQVLNKNFKNSIAKSILIIRYGKKYRKILRTYNFKILVLGKFHKERLSQIGVKNNNIEIFYNFIGLPKPTAEPIISKEKFFLYAGRISAEKGLPELIQTYLSCNFSDIKLYIVGEGPLMNRLKEDFQNKNVVFHGSLSNRETLNMISNSIAIVTNSKLFEGQPTILCEASALGVPSIYPDTGSISEFFPDQYKYKFNQFSMEDLREKLLLFSKEKNAERIGSENRKHILGLLSEDILINKFNNIMNSKT